MKTEIIHSLTKNFEKLAHQTNENIEFWFARDLQKLLGYTEWRNFTAVIEKAKISCKTSNEDIVNHFVDVNSMQVQGSVLNHNLSRKK